MKYINHMIALVAMAVTFTACYDETAPDIAVPKIKQTGDELSLLLNLRIAGEDATTRSLVSGEETRVSTMALICFNENGQYVGYHVYDASVAPDHYEGGKPFDSNGEAYTGIVPDENPTPDKGKIYAKIPKATTRIHFVANHKRIEDILKTFNVGTDSEGAMMRNVKMTSDMDENICYWGYVRKASIEDMTDWAEGTGETVWLIRDRAMVVLNSVRNQGLPKDYIKSVQWTAVNARSKGYIAPYNATNVNDPFSGYYGTYVDDEGQSQTGSTTTGIHEVTSASRYTEGAADDLAVNGTLYAQGVEGTSNIKPIYLFEDANIATDQPIKLIVAVTYQKQGQYLEETKYHTVLLKDEIHQKQFEVTRNHTYRLNITGLPRELGKETVAEAVASTDYSNGQMINVSEEATDVTDGAFTLKITTASGTSVVFQETENEDGLVKIPFTYYAQYTDPEQTNYNQPKYDPNLDPAKRAQDPQRKDVELFALQWTTNHGLAKTSADALFWTYNPGSASGGTTITDSQGNTLAPYEGYIYIKLNAISANLRDGKLWFRDQENGLQRYVNVYSISQYKLRTGDGATVFEKLNSTHDGKAVYHLRLAMPNEPNDYPEGLYPIEIKFATKTLNAYSDASAATAHGTFGVSVEDTSGLTNGTAGTWNADAKSWGYWYTYTIQTKEDFEALQSGGSNEINLYFEDVRSSRGTQPSDIGMYLQIKYFDKEGTYKTFSYTGNAPSMNLNQQ